MEQITASDPPTAAWCSPLAANPNSPLAAYLLPDTSADPDPELELLNEQLAGLGLAKLAESAVPAVADAAGRMLQRLSAARQACGQQQTAVTQARNKIGRVREAGQRARQQCEQAKAGTAELQKKLAGCERQAGQARSKLAHERDRYKREALLRSHREAKLEAETKRRTREINGLKQRLSKLMNTRPVPGPAVELSETLPAPAEQGRLFRPVLENPSTPPGEIGDFCPKEMHSERMRPRFRDGLRGANSTVGWSGPELSLDEELEANAAARAALQELRAAMQAAMIRVGVQERPADDRVRGLLRMPLRLVRGQLEEELDSVAQLIEKPGGA